MSFIRRMNSLMVITTGSSSVESDSTVTLKALVVDCLLKYAFHFVLLFLTENTSSFSSFSTKFIRSLAVDTLQLCFLELLFEGVDEVAVDHAIQQQHIVSFVLRRLDKAVLLARARSVEVNQLTFFVGLCSAHFLLCIPQK